jgi:hypothetical protein
MGLDLSYQYPNDCADYKGHPPSLLPPSHLFPMLPHQLAPNNNSLSEPNIYWKAESMHCQPSILYGDSD